MKYQRFEELPVWNDAIELAARLLGISQTGRLNGIGDLKSQLERAAISVSNNIAEGFERGTNEELITFLYIAKGSAGEMRSMLHLLARLPGMEELARDIQELLGRSENISRQLGRWLESLKDSDYRGKRYQNTRTRQAAEAGRRRDEFLERVREAQDEAIRATRPPADRLARPGTAGGFRESAHGSPTGRPETTGRRRGIGETSIRRRGRRSRSAWRYVVFSRSIFNIQYSILSIQYRISRNHADATKLTA